MRRFIFLTLILLLCTSCSNHITMNNIRKIEKGMRYEKFETTVSKSPKYQYIITNKNRSFHVEVYSIQTGTKTQTYASSTPSGGSGVFTSEKAATDDFVFIFYKKQLLFWGFFNELGKSEYPFIVNLAPFVIEKYEAVKGGTHAK